MEKVQEYAIEQIHASPAEDKQFRYKLIRATPEKRPAFKTYSLYGREIFTLPDNVNRYHVYVIGRAAPDMLNLKGNNANCRCNRTGWINAADDMNDRQFIFQMYDDLGRMFPRSHIYYKLNQEGSLVFVIKIDDIIKKNYEVNAVKYLRVYSYLYWNETTSSNRIKIFSKYIESRSDIVELQVLAKKYKDDKRGVLYYFVNGIYQQNISITTPVDSNIECFFDNQKFKQEVYKIGKLRTYLSDLDSVLKYFLFKRYKHGDDLYNIDRYKDDIDIYITGKNKEGSVFGLYYYQNRDHAVRNIGDWDLGLHTVYVNNQARVISDQLEIELGDIEIRLFVRMPTEVKRIHVKRSGMFLEELYKLPVNTQYNIMSGTSSYLPEWRAPYIENHAYMTIERSTDIMDITKELATEALGYSVISYDFGDTPVAVKEESILVPELYRYHALAYEYDEDGVLIGHYPSYSIYHKRVNDHAKFVEFIQGSGRHTYTLNKYHEKVTVDHNREYKVLTATFIESKRITDWVDVTNDPNTIRDGNEVTYSDTGEGHFLLIYLDEPYLTDTEISLDPFFPVFTLSMLLDVDGVETQTNLGHYPDTLELFMNGRRLIEGLDYFMKFPHIQICNKSYLTKDNKVSLHVRGIGYTELPENINKRDKAGFINNGVLLRNHQYDVIENRVFSLFVDGRLFPRWTFKYAEDAGYNPDPGNIFNGTPYTLSNRFIAEKRVTGLDTVPYFEYSNDICNRIESLFDDIWPEPKVDEFNVIRQPHLLFSPTVSKVIRDMKDGVIPRSFYQGTYSNQDVIDLLNKDYSLLMELDPAKKGLQTGVTVIHPDFSLEPVSVEVMQYRLITTVVDLITDKNPERINLSGYLVIDTGLD